MSFWDNNKDSFKKAGSATARGIGHGAKSISKAGYTTYKKHEAERKGLPPPGTDSPSDLPLTSVSPALTKDQLSALPAPPKRTVPTLDAPGRGGSSEINKILAKQPPQPQTQPQAVPQTPAQQQPPAQQLQSPPIQSPPLSQQPPQVQLPPRPVPVPQQSYSRPQVVAPEPAPPYEPVAIEQAQPQPVPASEVQRAPPPLPANARPSPGALKPAAAPRVAPQTTDSDTPRMPKPAPDVSSFAPPPIHRDRGATPQTTKSKPSVPSVPGRNSVSTRNSVSEGMGQSSPPPPYSLERQATASTAGSSVEAAFEPAPIASPPAATPNSFIKVDVSKLGPPPPRRYDSELSRTSTSSSGSAPPPPPPRPTSATSSIGGGSVMSPVATGMIGEVKVKKAPPPKPAKLKTNVSATATPEPDSAVSDVSIEADFAPEVVSPQPKAHNFAAEIANLRAKPTKSPSPAPSKPKRPSVSEPSSSRKSPRPSTPSQPSKLSTPSKPPKPASQSPAATGAPGTKGLKPEKPAKPVKPEKPAKPEKPVKPVMPEKPSRPSSPGISEKPVKPARPVSPAKPEKPARPSNPVKPEKPVKPSKPVKPVIAPKPGAPAPRHPAVTPPPQSPSPGKALVPPKAPPSRNSIKKDSAQSSPTPPPPPPARNYKRAPAPLPKNPNPPVVDLELSTGWFADISSPLVLPKCFEGLNYSSSYRSSSRTTEVGKQTDHCRTITVRFKDLSKASYAIKWKNADVAKAVVEVESFVPSPIDYRPPTSKQLEEYSQRFGTYVSSWCQHKIGQKVGSGECWDLARDALAKGCGKHAFVSQYYHHGYPILEVEATNSEITVIRGQESLISEGDILQFTSAKFFNKDTGVTQTVGSPNHTAVVTSKKGDIIRVMEQNAGGVKKVVKGTYVVPNLVSGKLIVYRPMPAEWAE